jgi:hypothetical protein
MLTESEDNILSKIIQAQKDKYIKPMPIHIWNIF